MKTTLLITAIICSVFSHVIEISANEKSTISLQAKQNSMTIDPKLRAFDYKEAFEILKKEKAPHKVCLNLLDGTCISNIIDLNVMGNSTIFLVRFNTPQGIKTNAIELGLIQSVGYLE